MFVTFTPPRCSAPPLENASCTMIAGASIADWVEKLLRLIVSRVLMNDRRPIGPASSIRTVLPTWWKSSARSAML